MIPSKFLDAKTVVDHERSLHKENIMIYCYFRFKRILFFLKKYATIPEETLITIK